MSTELPKPVKQRCDHFEAIAANLTATAHENPDKPGVSSRMLQAAAALEEAVRLIRLANWQARLNHDVIVARAEV